MRFHSFKQSFYFNKLILITLRVCMPDKRNTGKTSSGHRLLSSNHQSRTRLHYPIPFTLIQIWQLFYKGVFDTFSLRALNYISYRNQKTFFSAPLGQKKFGFIRWLWQIPPTRSCTQPPLNKTSPVALVSKNKHRTIFLPLRNFQPVSINYKSSSLFCKARHKVYLLNFCTAGQRLKTMKILSIFFCSKIINHNNVNCSL